MNEILHGPRAAQPGDAPRRIVNLTGRQIHRLLSGFQRLDIFVEARVIGTSSAGGGRSFSRTLPERYLIFRFPMPGLRIQEDHPL